MAEDPKKPTRGEMLKMAVSDVNIKNQKIIENPFNEQSTIISAKQLDVDRFATYDSKTYGKLGFDPFKDNNKIYNEKTHWSEDIGRAMTGMWKLAGVGFQDTFAFGLTAGTDSSKNFETVMKNYSSTRGGYTQFWSNTALSSGYTVGIIGAIAAEEIAMALTTGGLGNIGTGGLVGLQATRAFNRLGSITRNTSHIDDVARLGNIDEAVKFFSWKGVGQNLGKLGQKLNPVGETADFLRKSKLDEFSQFNDLQKVSLGAGAIARDARKLYMTHSESKLEADLAKSDFINKEIQKARLKSSDGQLTQEAINQIQTDGANVYNSTYMGNLGLIYATNAITFDNMFKSMRYSNKMFSVPGKFTTALGKDGLVVKAVKNFSGKRALAAGRKAIVDFSAKESARDIGRYIGKNYKVAGANLIKKGLSNSMEGVQELGQDVVSNSVQSYYGRNHAGQQVRGGFLENMWQAATDMSGSDIGDAIGGAMNQQGLETFGSGFFMGTIASPFGSSIGYLQKQIVGGGAKDKAQYLFNRQEFIKKQKSEYKKSLVKAKELTANFNAQLGSFLENTSNPLVTQSEFQEQILDAAQKGDKKVFEDKKHDSFQQGLKSMLKNNSEGMFTDFLEHMIDKFTPEQMNQAMGRNDITADNVAKYKAKLQTKVATVKSLRKKYDQINEQVVPPIRQSDIDRLDESDPEQRKQKLDLIIYKKAWENLKDELLFNNGKIANKAQRLIELEKQLNKETGLSPTEVQAFISKEGLGNEIKILQTQVEANKKLDLKGDDAKNAKFAELKLESLQKYQAALTAVEKAESADERSVDAIEDAYSDLFEAYHDYRSINPEYGMFYGKEEAEEVKRAISRKSFNSIVDYLDLSEESQALQDVVNTLVDPTSAKMWVDRNAEMMADLDKNKEKHIANQLYAFQEKAASSEMLTELQEAGIFFDLNELDDLVGKGIMPSEIYNIESNKAASKEEYQKAQDIISAFYAKLTGKTITQDKSGGAKRSLRYKEDKRTVKGLLRQYGIKLGKEIDLSDPVQLERMLRKLKSSTFLTQIDKELLDKVSDSMPRIMFVDNAEFPITMNEDGVFLIDVRYAGSDYKNVAVNFETLVLSALTQAKLNDNLEENEDLKSEVENLMQQAKDAFAKKYPNLDMDKISMFSNAAEFLSESLNNTAFQSFLGGVTDTVSGNKESLWKSLMAKIMQAFNKTFEKSVLQRAVSLSNMALDPSITENIDEKADETVVEEEKEIEPFSSVEKNGYKLMEVVPGAWQVTGNGEVKAFDTQAEAEAYFNEKTKPPKQKVKQTVKEKVTRTIEVGNTEFLDNASDNPELFGDFLHPEIVSNNNLAVAEWTQKLVDLGQALDDAKITNWTYGKIRAQVGGRLIIDVTAEVNGKQVKFLMYKSTGTGSTAQSLGEWVPLLAIGTHPNGNEWFVKAMYQGQDPKFNKYGSSVFADIDRDLKTQETDLFTGIKSTQEIEEEVETEIEVEVDAPEEVTAEEVQTEEQDLIDAETKLKTEINQKRELLKRINEQLASTKKVRLRKRMQLDAQKTKLLLDLKDLQEEYDAKFGTEASVASNETTIVETPVVEEEDLVDSSAVTQNTKFENLPEELQDRLMNQYRILLAADSVGVIRSNYKSEIRQLEALNRAMAQAPEEEVDALDEQFGTVFDALVAAVGPGFNIRLNEQSKIEISTIKTNATPSDSEINEIERLMKNDMSFMRTIIEYNNAVEPELVVELTEEEMLAKNAEAIEIGKQLKQNRLDKQKEEARARSRARKQSIVPITSMEREQVSELLQKVLKDDFEILTKADLTYLIDNLLNDSKTFRFKIPDVIAFVSKKKIKLEQDSQIQVVNETFADELEGLEPKERAEAVIGYQKDIFEELSENSAVYNYGLLSKYVQSKEPIKVSYNGKKYSFTLTPIELKALALYNKDLFARPLKTKEEETQFLINIHQLMQNVKYQANDFKKNLKFTGTPQEIEDQVVKLFFELMKKGVLLPSVVKAVNGALYNAKVKLTIARSNALSGSIYTLEERESVASRKQPKNKLAQDKLTIMDFVYDSGLPVTDPLWQEALIASWFSDPNNRVHPDFITKNIARGKSEIQFYKSFISNKSKFKTADGVGDAAAGDFAGDIQDADVYLQDAVNEIFGSYKSISEMVTSIAARIEELNNQQYGEEQYESDAEFENFIGTLNAEEAFANLEDYNNSLEFKISTGQLNLATVDYASLTPAQQLLFDQAVEDGLYDVTDAEAANDAANQEVEMPEETDMTTDEFLNYLNEIQAKETAVDKKQNELMEELRKMGDAYPFVPFLISQLNALENDKDLKLFLATYRLTNSDFFNPFTLKQKAWLNDKLMERLSQGAYIGQSLLIDETPMQIFSYNMGDKTVDLVDINTGEVKTLPMEQLFTSTDVFEEGQEYTKLNLDTVVNDQEIAYIKEAYQDIFNNFTASVAEFEKLENADLNSQILEQLTKCK